MKNKLTGEEWMDTINSKCDTTAHFTWKYVNTPAGLDRHIEIENIHRYQCHQLSDLDQPRRIHRLIDRLERELSDKVLFTSLILPCSKSIKH